MANTINNYTGIPKTDKGTKIMKQGQDMDKNAFLKILSAELSNMDPQGNNDSTQYVTQMAQFASMEQLTNLNTTMTNSATYSLVGKGVTMKSVDQNGNPYTGVIKGVSTSNGKYMVSVEINVNGQNEFKEFDVTDINNVLEVPDYQVPPLNNMNGNLSMLVAASYIGKYTELNEKDANGVNITGQVIGVEKKDGLVFVKLKVDETNEVKSYSYDKVVKASNESLALTQ